MSDGVRTNRDPKNQPLAGEDRSEVRRRESEIEAITRAAKTLSGVPVRVQREEVPEGGLKPSAVAVSCDGLSLTELVDGLVLALRQTDPVIHQQALRRWNQLGGHGRLKALVETSTLPELVFELRDALSALVLEWNWDDLEAPVLKRAQAVLKRCSAEYPESADSLPRDGSWSGKLTLFNAMVGSLTEMVHYAEQAGWDRESDPRCEAFRRARNCVEPGVQALADSLTEAVMPSKPDFVQPNRLTYDECWKWFKDQEIDDHRVLALLKKQGRVDLPSNPLKPSEIWDAIVADHPWLFPLPFGSSPTCRLCGAHQHIIVLSTGRMVINVCHIEPCAASACGDPERIDLTKYAGFACQRNLPEPKSTT